MLSFIDFLNESNIDPLKKSFLAHAPKSGKIIWKSIRRSKKDLGKTTNIKHKDFKIKKF